MGMKYFLVVVSLFVLILAFSAFAGDHWNESIKILRKPCEDFVLKHSDKTHIKKWTDKLKERIEQRIADNGGTFDQHLQSIALDWAADNANKIKDRDKDAMIEACLFFLMFHAHGTPPPKAMRERLTPDTAKELVYLLEEFEE